MKEPPMFYVATPAGSAVARSLAEAAAAVRSVARTPHVQVAVRDGAGRSWTVELSRLGIGVRVR